MKSKAFPHGTVRAWKNGTHMKNNLAWERIKTGRPKKVLRCKVDVEEMPYGYDSRGVFTDPNDFSQAPLPAAMIFGLAPEMLAQLEGFAEEGLEEKIQSPRTPKGKKAYFKSLHGWSKAAAKVASSYEDKLGDADPKKVKDHTVLRKALADLAKNMEDAFHLADKNLKER